jgi:hypothetical protein
MEKMSRHTRARGWALAVLVAVGGGACSAGGAQTTQDVSDPAPQLDATDATAVPDTGVTSEPEPPDWLELSPVGDLSPGGVAVFEVVVRPEVDGEVDLEILSPATLTFASGARSQRRRMRRNETPIRERLSWNTATDPGTSIAVRLSVLDEDGNPSLVVDRSLKVTGLPTAAAQELVAVVRTLPDGSRIVQRMTRAEAIQQNLSVLEQTLPADEAAPQEDTPTDDGDDRLPLRLQR